MHPDELLHIDHWRTHHILDTELEVLVKCSRVRQAVPWSLHYCVPFENFVKFNYSKQKFIIKNQHDTHLLDTGGWNNVSSPLYAPYTFGLPSWAVENHIAGSESSNRSRTCLCTDPMKTNLTRHHLWLLYNLYLRTLSPLLTVQRTPLLRQKCCLLPGCRAVVWICQVRHINGD